MKPEYMNFDVKHASLESYAQNNSTGIWPRALTSPL